MEKIFFLSKKKYFFLSISLILISFFFALNIYKYIYDGHHHGIMYLNALDLLNSRMPYSEIYIQYGILTTLIHSLSLLIFGNFVYSLNLVTIIFYSLTVCLIFLIVNNLINQNYAFISVLLLLSNHPVPWLPWSNYIAYFFLILSVFFFIKNNKYSFFLTGFFLSLCILSRQDFFFPILISLVLFNLVYFFNSASNKKNYDIINLILGFSLPLIFFFTYLLVNDLYLPWSKYLLIPNLFYDLHNVTLIDYIKNYINFFLFTSFVNFINEPQYLLISFILIINSIFLIIFVIKKNYNFIFISLLCLTLSSVSINIELFRLYTSVSAGVITFLYIISISQNSIKRLALFFLIATSLFSIIFYPTGNNESFTKIDSSKEFFNPKLSTFNYFKWESHHVNAINDIDKLGKLLAANCKIEYLENLTFNNYFNSIIYLKRVKLLPHIKSDLKNTKIFTYFDKGFVSNINSLIAKENIIVFVTGNNNKYEEGDVVITDKYSSKLINLNSAYDKPNILRIYYPTKCNFKS
jgi:hypothetical protein